MKLESPLPLTPPKPSAAASQHEANGLILFNSTGQLVFMNSEARFFIRQFDRPTTTENGLSHVIPDEVHTVVEELINQLVRCEHPKDFESLQIERLWFTGNQHLLLRGLCVPDAPLVRNSHLLIVMEQIDQTSKTPDINLQGQYHFTEREQMVITYVMLGFTNKEIANRLHISQFTVKDHLKRIMQKTKSTTRTGLLARMIFPHLFPHLKDGASLGSCSEQQ